MAEWSKARPRSRRGFELHQRKQLLNGCLRPGYVGTDPKNVGEQILVDRRINCVIRDLKDTKPPKTI